MNTPPISESTQKVLDYLASFEMFKNYQATGYTHAIMVAWTPNNHGYPYRATCSCGWQSRTYAATHAAQAMGDAHVSEMTK